MNMAPCDKKNHNLKHSTAIGPLPVTQRIQLHLNTSCGLLHIIYSVQILYSRKTFAGENFTNWQKFSISRRKLSRIANWECGLGPKNSQKKTFTEGNNTAKLTKLSPVKVCGYIWYTTISDQNLTMYMTVRTVHVYTYTA